MKKTTSILSQNSLQYALSGNKLSNIPAIQQKIDEILSSHQFEGEYQYIIKVFDTVGMLEFLGCDQTLADKQPNQLFLHVTPQGELTQQNTIQSILAHEKCLDYIYEHKDELEAAKAHAIINITEMEFVNNSLLNIGEALMENFHRIQAHPALGVQGVLSNNSTNPESLLVGLASQVGQNVVSMNTNDIGRGVERLFAKIARLQ